MKRYLTFAVSLLVASLALAACGSDDGELSDAELEYAAEVTKIGARAGSVLQSLSDLETETGFSDGEEARTLSEQLLEVFDEASTLEPPRRFQGEHESLIDGLEVLKQIGELNIEFIATGDSGALEEARSLNEDAFRPIQKAMSDVLEAIRESGAIVPPEQVGI